MKTNIPKKSILVILIVLVLGGTGYAALNFGIIDLSRFSAPNQPPTQEFMAQVNGENIRTTLFELRLAQTENSYEAQGKSLEGENKEILKQQILQDMISEILLVQYGKEQGIEAKQETVESEYERIIAQFPSEKEFLKNLSAQGISIEDAQRVIIQDLIIQQVIEQQAAQNNIEISEQEIQQAYDEAIAQGAQVPPLEEAKPQITNFLRQQKIGQLINTLLGQLREKASIEIFS